MVLFISGRRRWSPICAAFVNHIFGNFRNCNIEFNENEHTRSPSYRESFLFHTLFKSRYWNIWNFVSSVDGLTEYFAHPNTLECDYFVILITLICVGKTERERSSWSIESNAWHILLALYKYNQRERISIHILCNTRIGILLDTHIVKQILISGISHFKLRLKFPTTCSFGKANAFLENLFRQFEYYSKIRNAFGVWCISIFNFSTFCNLNYYYWWKGFLIRRKSTWNRNFFQIWFHRLKFKYYCS